MTMIFRKRDDGGHDVSGPLSGGRPAYLRSFTFSGIPTKKYREVPDVIFMVPYASIQGFQRRQGGIAHAQNLR